MYCHRCTIGKAPYCNIARKKTKREGEVAIIIKPFRTTGNKIGLPTFLVQPRNRKYQRKIVRKQKRNTKPRNKQEGEKEWKLRFLRKRNKREEIKWVEVSPKENILLLQSSRKQSKNKLSLKDNKVQYIRSWEWMYGKGGLDLEVGV